MSNPLDDNENAPDEALIGPGSTATGGGTAQDAADDTGFAETEGDDHIPPLDNSNGPAQLADEKFRSPGL